MRLDQLTTTNNADVKKKHGNTMTEIRAVLETVPEGGALLVGDLVTALSERLPTLPRPQAFVRFWHAERRKWFTDKYIIAYDASGRKFIGRKPEVADGEE